jgi:hypothetical protein
LADSVNTCGAPSAGTGGGSGAGGGSSSTATPIAPARPKLFTVARRVSAVHGRVVVGTSTGYVSHGMRPDGVSYRCGK